MAEDFESTLNTTGKQLFILKPEDTDSLELLQSL